MISQQGLEDFLPTMEKIVLEWLSGVTIPILIYLTKNYYIQCGSQIHTYTYIQSTYVHIYLSYIYLYIEIHIDIDININIYKASISMNLSFL